MDANNSTLAQPIQQPAVQPEVCPASSTLVEVIQPEVVQAEAIPPKAAQTEVTPPIPGKKRGGRMARLKRTSESFRPGSAPQKVVPTVPVKAKTLTFFIPAECEHGKVEEFQHIHRIATQIAGLPQLGAVTLIAIHDKTWEITLTLFVLDGADNEKVLSDAFRTLMPTIEGSSELRNGFCIGNSSKWKYHVGTNLLDEDRF